MKNRKLFLLLWCAMWIMPALAVSDANLVLSTNAKQKQFESITQEVRCVVCQNEDLFHSQAQIAQDLRLKIAKLIEQDKSDEEIKSYLINRYGEFILYKPTYSGKNLPLWLMPFLLILLGGVFIRRRMYR